MKVSIVQFPGSHGIDDMRRACGVMFGTEGDVVWHGEESIKPCDLLVIPGGASFGDTLRPGALTRASTIAPAIRRFSRDGRVLGIGNGFQILCELGILPGVFLPNRDLKFYSGEVPCGGDDFDEDLDLPVACLWGRFYLEPKARREMENSGSVLLEAVEAAGPFEEGDVIAARNAKGNVVGIIARPERAMEGDGRTFLAKALSGGR